MALVCNIDQRGRQYRYRIGAWLLLLGVIGGGLGAFVLNARVSWIVGGVLVLGGLVSWFEAHRGWCVARAMGFKTRI